MGISKIYHFSLFTQQRLRVSKTEWRVFSTVLNWVSVKSGSDYVILQIDQAPAHTSSAISWAENIIPFIKQQSQQPSSKVLHLVNILNNGRVKQ
ncbi:hypothetical protein [uncultured Nostoc sp.]|uniref:hypothetical protein n=1 Tax=uncultured Nostoc sp. TaxID=340711 RepID=UPI0035CA434C